VIRDQEEYVAKGGQSAVHFKKLKSFTDQTETMVGHSTGGGGEKRHREKKAAQQEYLARLTAKKNAYTEKHGDLEEGGGGNLGLRHMKHGKGGESVKGRKVNKGETIS